MPKGAFVSTLQLGSPPVSCCRKESSGASRKGSRVRKSGTWKVPRTSRQTGEPAGSQLSLRGITSSTWKVCTPAACCASSQAKAWSRIEIISCVSDRSLDTTKSKARISSSRSMPNHSRRRSTGARRQAALRTAGMVEKRPSRIAAKGGSAATAVPSVCTSLRTATM